MKKRDFITEDLISKIYQHEFKDNQLPPQRKLAAQYDVSRYTIQKVLERLKSIGIIQSIQGDGIYVKKQIYEQPLIYNSMTETSYHDIQSKTIYLKKIPAEAEIGRAFGLKAGTLVWEYQRIRIVKFQIAQLETTFMPADFFPDLHPKDIEGSIQHYVLKKNLEISHHITNYQATLVNRDQALLLNCKKGIPAMEISSRGLLTDGRIFEYSRILALDYSCTYIVPFHKEHHKQRHRDKS